MKIQAIDVKDAFGKINDANIKKALDLVTGKDTKIYVVSKMGRPTKYSPKLCERLPALFANGESVAEVCAELGIWKDTFYEWVKLYPDFSDAYKKGKELSEAWWTKIGRIGSTGKVKIQPATWIFNMKNRFKWKDRIDANLTGDLTVANITSEERKQIIAELIQKANGEPANDEP